MTDLLTFNYQYCGQGEKAIKGCHRVSMYIITVVAWIAIAVISVVGLGFLFKTLLHTF